MALEMRRLASSLTWLAAIGLLLAGCVSQPPSVATDAVWEQQLAQLSALDDWQFRGKVAIATAATSESARVRWAQQGKHSEVVLSGPVGWSSATLVSDGSTLRLQRDGQWQEFAADDYLALEDQLGWPLPVSYLPYWVRGVPAPGLPAEQLEIEGGRLLELRQAGWRVEYDDYQQAGEYQVPARMRISREGVKGKLILRDWQFGSTS
jgi:outer membrane lipoprotein LolB